MGIPPTGKEVTFGGNDIYRLVDGKIAEEWAQFDALGLMQQLGAVFLPTGAS
jgi:predicted ester cyclase